LGRNIKGKTMAAKPIIQKILENKISGEFGLTAIELIKAVIPKTEVKLTIIKPILIKINF